MKRSKDKFYMKQIFDCISDGEIIATGKIAKEIGLSEKSVRNRLNELSDFLLENNLGEIQRKPRVGICLEANENQKDNSSSESSNNVITQLEKLSKLKENGILTQEEFDIQKQQILNSKEKINPIENKSDKKVFIISAVFVLFLVILGAFIGLKDKFNDFSFVKAENKFGIKEINNLINLNDDFKTSCEKLKMLSPYTYTITPGESYYWCSINDRDINLISYDNNTVDGFVTTFNYNGFQNLSIEEVKKLFRKKGYKRINVISFINDKQGKYLCFRKHSFIN